MPKPRWMPRPQVLYAQVVKTVRRRRLVGVKHRVVFGTLEAIEQVLSVCGWQINTAFVARLNLDIRQRVAAVGRRVNTLCQGEDGLHHQLVLFQASHTFVLPLQRTPAVAGSEAHQRDGLREEVAALYAGDGGRIDRPRVDAASGAALSRATGAAAPNGVRGEQG